MPVKTESPPNCWEVFHCGKGPDALDRGDVVCPAALAYAMTGVHDGEAGGRACWAVAGSLATGVGARRCHVATSCLECAFYHSVRLDEGPAFRMWPGHDTSDGSRRMRLRSDGGRPDTRPR